MKCFGFQDFPAKARIERPMHAFADAKSLKGLQYIADTLQSGTIEKEKGNVVLQNETNGFPMRHPSEHPKSIIYLDEVDLVGDRHLASLWIHDLINLSLLASSPVWVQSSCRKWPKFVGLREEDEALSGRNMPLAYNVDGAICLVVSMGGDSSIGASSLVDPYVYGSLVLPWLYVWLSALCWRRLSVPSPVGRCLLLTTPLLTSFSFGGLAG
eukprot:Gb_14251 [translate_table: standard]